MQQGLVGVLGEGHLSLEIFPYKQGCADSRHRTSKGKRQSVFLETQLGCRFAQYTVILCLFASYIAYS